MGIAGRSWFGLYAVVHHRGRSSGREYAVPVAVVPTLADHVVLIGLPWGERTNWVRNVLAAGGATLTWRGRDVTCTHPRVVDNAEATAMTRPGLIRKVIASGRVPAFLVLDIAP
jgi:deazaflavin-dependent oxidoreductase (nitroreductase family)